MDKDVLITARYRELVKRLDERQRRLYVAAEAKVLGHGGVKRVSDATGVARSSILAGLKELKNPEEILPAGRIRRLGGGRKKLLDRDPGLLAELECLIEPATAPGDPPSSLRWTCKSLKQLATELDKKGHHISHVSVGILLREMGYSLRGVRKPNKHARLADPADLFQELQKRAVQMLQAGQPLIMVDIQKNKWVDDNIEDGQISEPLRSKPMHAPISQEVLGDNSCCLSGVPVRKNGWVNAGADHETFNVAVSMIRSWWFSMGRGIYPAAKELLIVVNVRLNNKTERDVFDREIQSLSHELHLNVWVCHMPAGTYKWNGVVQRIYSNAHKAEEGGQLVNHEVIVTLIAAAKEER